MTATDRYRESLGGATATELADERRRLHGALCGEDLDRALPETRALLEGQLEAVEAEQAGRHARGHAAGAR